MVILAWLGLFVLAFANGALRELVLVQFLEGPWAHHASVLTICLLFFGFVRGIWGRLGIATPRRAWLVGLLWAAMTVFTETVILGWLWGGKSWGELLQAYDVLGGSSWPLVLVFLAVLPRAICRRPASNSAA